MKLQKEKGNSRQATLTFDSGNQIKVQWLGQGTFAQVWGDYNNAYAIMYSRRGVQDYSKELMSWAYASESNNPHLVPVERVGYIQDKAVYVMPQYEMLTAKHKTAWLHFRELKEMWQRAWAATGTTGTECREYFVRLIDGNQVLPESLKQAIEALHFSAYNFGDQTFFEFAKRNLAVTSKGDLVLLDITFDWNQLCAVRGWC